MTPYDSRFGKEYVSVEVYSLFASRIVYSAVGEIWMAAEALAVRTGSEKVTTSPCVDSHPDVAVMTESVGSSATRLRVESELCSELMKGGMRSVPTKRCEV